MRSFLTLAFVCLIAQHDFAASYYTSPNNPLNGYRFVFIKPIYYQNGSRDVYNIEQHLRSFFIDRGMIIFQTQEEVQAFGDECLGLQVEVEHGVPVVGSDACISINLLNCLGKSVYFRRECSMVFMEWNDFVKPTNKALAQLKEARYVFNGSLTPRYPVGEVIDETEESLRRYFSENAIDNIEGIWKDMEGSYKIAIKQYGSIYKAINLESKYKGWVAGEVKAEFEETSVPGVYALRWWVRNKSKSETFCFLKDDIFLNFELTAPNGEKIPSQYLKLFPSVVKRNEAPVEHHVSTGTGFFLSTDGLIATNDHVVRGSKKIMVRTSNATGTSNYKAKIVLADQTNDVAILKIEDEKFSGLSNLPYELVEKAEIGEKVFTIGFPMPEYMGTNFKVTDGLISASSGLDDDFTHYQISVPVQPGNSGGPLFNRDGNIVGITSASLRDGQNVNYAVKIAYLLNVYKMLPAYAPQKSMKQVAGKELHEQVKVLKDFVCLITSEM